MIEIVIGSKEFINAIAHVVDSLSNKRENNKNLRVHEVMLDV